MRKTSKLLALSAAIMFLIPTAILAYETKTGTAVFIGENDEVQGSLYTAGQSITIESDIKGDLVCGAQSILVNGDVDGDIICAGQSIIINGNVSGDIRLAAETISINGSVARNANLFGMSLSVGPDAIIERDVFLAGAFSNISGKINGNLHGAVAAMDIDAEIGGDVKLRLADNGTAKDQKIGNLEPGLKIGEEAIIGGNLYYTASSEAKIGQGAIIKGEKGFSKTKLKTNQNSNYLFVWNTIYKIFASLVIGLVLISLFRKPIVDLIDLMKVNKGGAIGRGVVLMFITPFIVILLLITLIGAPLALLLLSAWLISFCIAKILFGIFLGQELIKSLKHAKEGANYNPSLIISMIVGVSVLQILSSIAILGWMFSTIAIWWGLGGMWLYAKGLATGK